MEVKEPVIIYFCFPHYGGKRFQLIKSCTPKITLNCKNDQPVAYKILYEVCITKGRTPIVNQVLFSMSSGVLFVVQITSEKPKEHYMSDVHTTLYEHAWRDQNSIVKNSSRPVC